MSELRTSLEEQFKTFKYNEILEHFDKVPFLN